MKQVVEALCHAQSNGHEKVARIRGQAVSSEKIRRWKRSRTELLDCYKIFEVKVTPGGDLAFLDKPLTAIEVAVVDLTGANVDFHGLRSAHRVSRSGSDALSYVNTYLARQEDTAEEPTVQANSDLDMPDLAWVSKALRFSAVEGAASLLADSSGAAGAYISGVELQKMHDRFVVNSTSYDPFVCEVYPFPTSAPSSHSRRKIYGSLASLNIAQASTLLNLHRQALPKLAQHLGVHHPDVVNAKLRLGSLYGISRQFLMAEQVLLETADAIHKAEGFMSRKIWLAYSWLLDLLMEQESYARAARLYTDLIGPAKQHLKETDPLLSHILGTVSMVMNAMARDKESLDFCRQALQIQLSTLGPHNELSQDLLYRLASILSSIGKPQESEALSVVCLQLSPSEKLQIKGLRHLSRALRKQGRMEESLSHHERAEKLAQGVLGPRDDMTISLLVSKAAISREIGNKVESEKICRQILKVYTTRAGGINETAVRAMACLVELLWEKGECEEAIKLSQQVLERNVDMYGVDDDEVFEYCEKLGKRFEQLALFGEAHTLYRNTLQRVTSLHGHWHDIAIRMRDLMGKLPQCIGDGQASSSMGLICRRRNRTSITWSVND